MIYERVEIFSNELVIKHAKYVEKLMKDNPTLSLDEAWYIVPRVFITKEKLEKRYK